MYQDNIILATLFAQLLHISVLFSSSLLIFAILYILPGAKMAFSSTDIFLCNKKSRAEGPAEPPLSPVKEVRVAPPGELEKPLATKIKKHFLHIYPLETT